MKYCTPILLLIVYWLYILVVYRMGVERCIKDKIDYHYSEAKKCFEQGNESDGLKHKDTLMYFYRKLKDN